MPLSVTPQTSLPPSRDGEMPVLGYWLSSLLLATVFLYTLVAAALKSKADPGEALLLLLATWSTLAALVRQLPAQNALLAATIIALIGGAAHWVGVKSGVPFGPFMFGPEIGWKLLNTLPWTMPLLWVVAVLNSRGVARLVLRPWRKIRAYGFWLIGLTALFTMLFDGALEPFAVQSRHHWIWTNGGYSLTPEGAPISNSVGWFVITLLMLAFVTPLLINKQLSKRSVPDFHPLAVWLGGLFLFAVAAARHEFWAAAAMDAVIGIVAATFAIRGGRW